MSDYDDFNLMLWKGDCPAYAYMVYLRHHGFPSPLLDWTRSPYVAAFFALNDARDSKGCVSIYALGETKFTLSGNNMPLVYRYGPYVKTHRRHFLQQSEYTLCLGFDDEWRFEQYDTVFTRGRQQQGFCWRYTMPATERTKVLRLLDEHNLNAFSLFGSEESMMMTLATREFMEGVSMEESPTLERVNDGLYRCSVCKDGFRIERNYAGPKRTEQQRQIQREKDFREHLKQVHTK